MSNLVTQDELDQARKTCRAMSDEDRTLLQETVAEQQFERNAAFGGGGYLAPSFVVETGELVSSFMYELCYKARVDKLFEDRDNAKQ